LRIDGLAFWLRKCYVVRTRRRAVDQGVEALCSARAQLVREPSPSTHEGGRNAMRVAVLGSWDDRQNRQAENSWPLLATPADFKAACREIGRELVSRGHSLIVGSDREHTADRHAALGALDAVRDSGAATRIAIVKKSSSARSFEELRRSHPAVFVEERVAAGSEAAAKLFQVRLADALILVGGGQHTEQAGLAAAATGKPLACIGSFGGTALALNRRFREAPEYWGYGDGQANDLLALREPFGAQVLKRALKLAWIEGAPKLMVIHGRSPDRDALKLYLEELGVGKVVVLVDEFAPSTPIPEKFERYAASVDGAIALLTPDDLGGLAEQRQASEPRARQNVWLEVGWFWGRRGRSRLLLLRKGEIEIPSDIGNVEHYSYTADPLECGKEIRKFVRRLLLASDVDSDADLSRLGPIEGQHPRDPT
jgi:hypothetical protein